MGAPDIRADWEIAQEAAEAAEAAEDLDYSTSDQDALFNATDNEPLSDLITKTYSMEMLNKDSNWD